MPCQSESVFEGAARLLATAGSSDHATPLARDLLNRLGYEGGADTGDDENATAGRIALLRVASRLERVFQLPSRAAPGLVLIGGEIAGPDGHDKVGVAGAGLSFGAAFESCMGEAAEVLSQIEAPDDLVRLAARPAPAPLSDASMQAYAAMLGCPDTEVLERLDWLGAERLADRMRTRLPADLCLRRQPHLDRPKPVISLGSGCAAGRTLEEASLHAVLELVERDAAALWWIGGRPPRQCSLELIEKSGVSDLIGRLRKGESQRRTWLLDITSDLKIPCIAAVSVDGEDRRFGCGLAARTRVEEAMQAALFELCAMELNYELDEARRLRGMAPTKPRAGSVKHDFIQTSHPAVLQGRGFSALETGLPGQPANQQLEHIGRALAAQGLDIVITDLTRDHLGIAAVRALAPGLQPLTTAVRTERLSRALDEFGGGDLQRQGMNLL